MADKDYVRGHSGDGIGDIQSQCWILSYGSSQRGEYESFYGLEDMFV